MSCCAPTTEATVATRHAATGVARTTQAGVGAAEAIAVLHYPSRMEERGRAVSFPPALPGNAATSCGTTYTDTAA